MSVSLCLYCRDFLLSKIISCVILYFISSNFLPTVIWQRNINTCPFGISHISLCLNGLFYLKPQQSEHVYCNCHTHDSRKTSCTPCIYCIYICMILWKESLTRLTRRAPLVEQWLLILPEHLSSPPVFSGVRVTRSLVLCVCFVGRCLPFCTFSFDHFVVCSSIYGFCLPLWYLLKQNIGHLFHQYQQNEQSPLILTELTEHKRTTTYDVGNPGVFLLCHVACF